jgi:hypothetical protein
VEYVELLGTQKLPAWQQDNSALHVALRDYRPEVDYAAALKIHVAS